MELEYLVVDGGSSDNSVEIIKKYSEWITWWVSEPDSGQAEAINKGLQRSTGEIVGWLNSDDMYAPGAIKEAVSFFKANPEIGLFFGDGVSFDQDGCPLNDLKVGDWGLEELVAFNIICQPAVFFRRSLLAQVGLLDEKYDLLLDHQLWIRIAGVTEIRHVPSVWAFARNHPGAKNVVSASRFFEDSHEILEWMLSQPDIQKVINQNYRTVMAMFHRFNARYFLDGNQSWQSLKSYWLSMKLMPGIALKEWHRMLFAILSLLGMRNLGRFYYRLKKTSIPDSVLKMNIRNIHDLYSGSIL